MLASEYSRGRIITPEASRALKDYRAVLFTSPIVNFEGFDGNRPIYSYSVRLEIPFYSKEICEQKIAELQELMED